MKYTEVTFKDMFQALRHQWKMFLGFVVGFTALGIVSGLIWADGLVASPRSGGTVEGLLIPDFSAISCDPVECISYSNQLSEAYVRAASCCLFLQREVTLDPAQREALQSFGERLEELESTELQTIWNRCAALAEVDASNMLPDSEQRLEEELNQACQKLGSLIAELHLVVNEIAESKHLDVFVFYDKTINPYYITPLSSVEGDLLGNGNLEEKGKMISVVHSSGYRSQEKAFLNLTLFCLLVGICAGTFFAVIKGTQNKRQITVGETTEKEYFR